MGGKNKKDAPSDTVAFPHGAGSNFVFLDLGDYLNDNSKWNTDVKVTLLHYNTYRTIAKKRLGEMYKNGQSKLAVMLWYIEDGAKCTYYSHVVCPQKGKIHKDIEENIKKLIEDADSENFDTLIFRFAAQHKADPLSEDYQIHRVEDTWNLIDKTIPIVEAAAKGKRIKILYDLGVETMGHPFSNRSGAQEFLNSIWRRYINKYSTDKTVGFTFNHAHGKAVENSLRVYDSSGQWPKYIGVDIYSDPSKHLGNLASALGRFGKASHPVIVTETYYNSENMAKHFRNAKSKLNLQFILQWPLSEGSNTPHSSNPETPSIAAYIPLNNNNTSGTRVVRHNEQPERVNDKKIEFIRAPIRSDPIVKTPVKAQEKAKKANIVAKAPAKAVAQKSVKAAPKAVVAKSVAKAPVKKVTVKTAPKAKVVTKAPAKKAVAQKSVKATPKAVVAKSVAKAPVKKVIVKAAPKATVVSRTPIKKTAPKTTRASTSNISNRASEVSYQLK